MKFDLYLNEEIKLLKIFNKQLNIKNRTIEQLPLQKSFPHWYWDVKAKTVRSNSLTKNRITNGFVKLVYKADVKKFQNALDNFLNGLQKHFKVKVRIATGNKKWEWVYIYGDAIVYDGKTPRILSGFVYFIEKDNAFDVFEINLDQITKTLSCERLIESLRNKIHSNENFSIALIDINQFNEINKDLLNGENVLLDVAKTLKKNINEHDYVGRYTRDIFLIVFPNSNHKKINKIINKIKKMLQKSNISITSAIKEYDGGTVVDLLREADIELYYQKNIR